MYFYKIIVTKILMRNIHHLHHFIYTALVILLFAGCSEDESVTNPDLPISRLLVSSGTPGINSTSLSMFSPADQESFGAPIGFNMVNPNGSGVIYDNVSNLGFQIGMLTKTIRTFSINTDGTLRILNSFRDSTLMDGRGIAYNRAANQLYVSSSSDSTIHVYNNASNITGNITSARQLKLNCQPWGVFFDAGKLLVVGDLEVKKVLVLDNISSLTTATVTAELTIPTATRLHGITYSAKKDILIVTDIGETSGASSNSDGAIYIFEGIKTQLAASANLTPSQTITGNTTLLGNPVDVTFDDREGKDIIYIAEKANSKVLGFKFSNEGNVAPYLNASAGTPPESVWVDAR
jgi:DNA-binding beta-propeller fold protein YncE